jgi:hypothetical protein
MVPDLDRGQPAFYAAVGRGRRRDWWTLLHPPYTAWHLSYVVIGSALAPRIDWVVFAGTLFSFFLAVGVSAHALDELHGRPLGTALSARTLIATAVLSLLTAASVGAALLTRVGLALAPLIVVGVVLVLGYNLELFGGRLHTRWGFALSWGAFPLIVGYLAQARTVTVGAVIAAAAAAALTDAQRALSTPARMVRRQTVGVTGALTLRGGEVVTLTPQVLLTPLETALRALSYAMVLLATGLAFIRWG